MTADNEQYCEKKLPYLPTLGSLAGQCASALCWLDRDSGEGHNDHKEGRPRG